MHLYIIIYKIRLRNLKEDDAMVFSIKCECGETAHWNKDLSVYVCEDCEATVNLYADNE
jgi:hypothetical protein